jgi:hypothetical protein
MVCPPANSEAGARWPRRGLVVVATTSCRDNKVQMIRPLKCGVVTKNSLREFKNISRTCGKVWRTYGNLKKYGKKLKKIEKIYRGHVGKYGGHMGKYGGHVATLHVSDKWENMAVI